MSNISSAKKTGRPRIDATPVNVRVPPDLLRDIDAFIEDRRSFGDDLTRPEALRFLASEALITMGLRKP